MANDIDDGLTDEERAALAEDGGESEGFNPPADDNTDAEAAAAAAAAEKQAADAAATKAAEDAAAAEAAAKKDAPIETQAIEADATKQQPILVVPALEDADARLAEIATKKDALLTQFDDGDITAREYQKQLDALAKEERQIEFQQHEASLASKLEQQRLQNEWTSTCNSFVETHPIYKNNDRLYRALDAEVRELAAKPETANWTGQRFLDEAHNNLKTAFGFAEAETGKPQAKPKYDQTASLPPNLSKVPSAEIESTTGGKYAVLDRLASTDPLGYEAALERMSEAERNAYLAS